MKPSEHPGITTHMNNTPLDESFCVLSQLIFCFSFVISHVNVIEKTCQVTYEGQESPCRDENGGGGSVKQAQETNIKFVPMSTKLP